MLKMLGFFCVLGCALWAEPVSEKARCTEVDRLVVIVAMRGEASPMIHKWGLLPCDTAGCGIDERLGIEVFHKEINGKQLYLVLSGVDSACGGVDRIGTQAAIISTFSAIQAFKPDLVLNIGTAGGVNQAKVGEIYYSEYPIVNVDRKISLSDEYQKYGTGYFPPLAIPEKWVEDLGFIPGTIGTSNSFDPTPRDMEEFKRLEMDAVDMELAACAEICQRCGVPIFGIKMVVNEVNLSGKTADDFLANYQLLVDHLAENAGEFINRVLTEGCK